MSEMYRLGPLSENPEVDLPPTIPQNDSGEHLCRNLENKLNTVKQPNDLCHWTYTCDFNSNRFPSMIISANECTTTGGASCIQRFQRVKTFVRTFNSNQEPTWQNGESVSVVYGYTCRSGS